MTGLRRGVHLLTPLFGPVPESIASCPAARPVSWAVQCVRCSRTALGTGRWTAFAKTTCSADLVDMPRHETRLHHLARVPNGWCCLRCDLCVSPARRASAATARCPVPELVSPTGQDLLAARPWLGCAVRLAHQWRLFARACAPAPHPGPPPSPPEASAVAASAVGSVGLVVGAVQLRWTPHWVLTGVGRSACLRCGLTGRTRDPARLHATACAAVPSASNRR